MCAPSTLSATPPPPRPRQQLIHTWHKDHFLRAVFQNTYSVSISRCHNYTTRYFMLDVSDAHKLKIQYRTG